MGRAESRLAYEITAPSHDAVRQEVLAFIQSRGVTGAARLLRLRDLATPPAKELSR